MPTPPLSLLCAELASLASLISPSISLLSREDNFLPLLPSSLLFLLVRNLAIFFPRQPEEFSYNSWSVGGIRLTITKPERDNPRKASPP
jgi:hypothetical protein